MSHLDVVFAVLAILIAGSASLWALTSNVGLSGLGMAGTLTGIGLLFGVFGMDALFWVIAAVTVGSATVVAFSPNLVRSVFALFFTLGGVAGLFVFLGADFLGVVQVILYVGGILILLIFGILLTNRDVEGPRANQFTRVAPALLIAGAVLYLVVSSPLELARSEAHASWRRTHASAVATSTSAPRSLTRIVEDRNSTLDIGRAFLETYLIPFELASVVLLIGLLGAASIARKEIGA